MPEANNGARPATQVEEERFLRERERLRLLAVRLKQELNGTFGADKQIAAQQKRDQLNARRREKYAAAKARRVADVVGEPSAQSPRKRKKKEKRVPFAKRSRRREGKIVDRFTWFSELPCTGRRLLSLMRRRVRWKNTSATGRWVYGAEQVNRDVYTCQFASVTGGWVDQFQYKRSTRLGQSNGLYAARDFAAGEVITVYCGRVATTKRGKYPESKFFMAEVDIDGKKKLLDAAGGPWFLGAHFVNHSRESANVVMESTGHFVTTRIIKVRLRITCTGWARGWCAAR